MSSGQRPRRKRKSDLNASSQVLQNLFQDGKSELSSQFQRWRLWYKWSEVVGTTISKHCEPVWFARGTLYIWVRSSSWLQQLIFMNAEIKDRINEASEKPWVKRIRFTTDRRSVPDHEDARENVRDSIDKIR